MSKTLTLAATGLAGLVLGAGIGVASAGQDQMPAERAEQCDEMHAAMGGHMDAADMPGNHRDHHRRTER